MRSNYSSIILRAAQHIKRILTPNLLNTYLESYPPSIKKLYHTYVPQRNVNDLDDDEKTPTASAQMSQIKDSKETNNYPHTGMLNRNICFNR